MKLTGYQARKLLRSFEIPVPEDLTTGDTEQTYQIESDQSIHMAIVTDYAARCPVLQVSFLTDRTSAHFRQPVDALRGLHIYQANAVASEMDFPRDYWPTFVEICLKLYKCYTTSDALQVEIKPLALVTGGKLVALNGLVVIDENAMYRHANLESLRDTAAESTTERLAREAGLRAISMPGQIACMVNGAGLAMTTIDLIDYYGAEDGIHAASFIEIDSGDSPEQMAKSLGVILADLSVKAVIISIFCGITRCDDVAYGLVLAFRQVQPAVPVIIRLQGTNASEGRRIVENARLPNTTCTDTSGEAAYKAVTAVKRHISHVHPD